MVNGLMGWDCIFAFMPYGERWRQQRKMFYQEFTPTAALRYNTQESVATAVLLNRLLDTPDDWVQHLRLQAGEVVMSVAYGISVKDEKDMFLDVIEKALAGLNIAARPGAFLVDILPILKYVPSWMPGAGFKRMAEEWREATEQMVDLPYQAAKDGIASGTATPSYTSYLLEGLDPKADNTEAETMIKQTAGAIYSAGADTSVAVLRSFVLAMVWYPEVQKKAQAELDAVLGKGHLPEFSDEASLPYCNALVKEVFRWRPATPIAIPRETDTEDVYQGMRIPASTVIINNAWAILHDERNFPEPEVFKPERFLKDGKLNPDVMDPTEVGSFGFGRRVCPGRFLAMNSVWITVTSMLAAMNITQAVDESGAIIEPTGEMTGGMVQ
ncbi:hypothetical protein HWV62_14496 [Athelia sp. TMB]|nr:hypothetical protein HWV62_14496 [Athelia sp. TMB]